MIKKTNSEIYRDLSIYSMQYTRIGISVYQNLNFCDIGKCNFYFKAIIKEIR